MNMIRIKKNYKLINKKKNKNKNQNQIKMK